MATLEQKLKKIVKEHTKCPPRGKQESPPWMPCPHVYQRINLLKDLI